MDVDDIWELRTISLDCIVKLWDISALWFNSYKPACCFLISVDVFVREYKIKSYVPLHQLMQLTICDTIECGIVEINSKACLEMLLFYFQN